MATFLKRFQFHIRSYRVKNIVGYIIPRVMVILMSS